MTDKDLTTFGIMPVVKIDGDTVRTLRESKGLTQLYVATSVGVTTDTISRWENRRYPSIKKENALKLAEALEVELEEIESREAPEDETNEDQAPATATARQEPPGTAGQRRNIPWPLTLALVFTLALTLGLVLWRILPNQKTTAITATRLLPRHTAPGQPFPVLIKINHQGDRVGSLIIKESFPPGAVPLSGSPPFTTIDQERHFIKWISKATEGADTFAYVTRPGQETIPGRSLIFSGEVTLRKGAGPALNVAGPETLTIGRHHWSDTNSDNLIDDEEILAVYDTFGAIEQLDFDKTLIDEIWSGSGYRWDADNHKFIVLP